jgi:DNA-directed RNA polymerase specialized sigma24 family protein
MIDNAACHPPNREVRLPMAQLIQRRVFACLTIGQAAEILGLSTSSADRHWAYARACLRGEFAGRDAPAVD